MANLTETTSWEPGIYQLERADLWDAGTGGDGVANLAVKQLANRTTFLKAWTEAIRTRQNHYLEYADQTIGSGMVINAKGTPYVLNYPLADWDYISPDDGLTRDYMVELCCHVGPGFNYSASASVSFILHTSTPGPGYVELIRVSSFQPGVSIMSRKKIQLGPNVRVRAIINVGSIGASVQISHARVHIEEII
jgi:hypothetical protein